MNCLRLKKNAIIFILLGGLSIGRLFAGETDCEALDGLVPICGINGSEDMEVFPDRKHLIISESRTTFNANGEMRWLQGNLGLLDLNTEQVRVLYPGKEQPPGDNKWGDADCPGEPLESISPHGIYLSRRADGAMQLLVVNHGGRESVEFFQVLNQGQGIQLIWRGCVVMPEQSFLNDVVALPDGGLLVTHMVKNDGPQALMEGGERAINGETTGHIWRWRPDKGIDKLPGSEAGMPNGIQIDDEGQRIYVSTLKNRGEVQQFDLINKQWTGSAAVGHPDNLSWSEDGHLLVAGVTDDAVVEPCFKADFREFCGAEFHVDAVDTETMSATRLLQHEGPPLGLATVAVQAGEYLYIGSAAGDRIVKFRMPALIAK